MVVLGGGGAFLMGEVPLYHVFYEFSVWRPALGPSSESGREKASERERETLLLQGHLTKCLPLGPYGRPMPRALWWSKGGCALLWARYPCMIYPTSFSCGGQRWAAAARVGERARARETDLYYYIGTAFIRKRPSLEPYSRPMPRALWWS